MLYVIVFAITLVVSQVIAGVIMFKLMMNLMTNEKFLLKCSKKMVDVINKLQMMEMEEKED